MILYGPRQVGKTTLAREVVANLGWKTLEIDGAIKQMQDLFGSRNLDLLREAVSGYQLLFLDEAQKIPDIGENLKLLIDHVPEIKILATGSSSFDLANHLAEPLTGRKWSYTLYPIALCELERLSNQVELRSQLESRLVWGSYPEVFSLSGHQEKRHYLLELASDYLYRDVLELAEVRQAGKIKDLLRLIAFQIGSQVSISELATSLELNRDTVERYLDLLEKSFVLFRLGGFSRNLRKEVRKMDKIYFYDLGVRNAVIDNFNLLTNRDDVGKIWENFLIVERLKKNAYRQSFRSPYFWRLQSGAEIDYLEEYETKIDAFEFKWRKRPSRHQKSFSTAYPQAKLDTVNRDNFLKFVL